MVVLICDNGSALQPQSRSAIGPFPDQQTALNWWYTALERWGQNEAWDNRLLEVLELDNPEAL